MGRAGESPTMQTILPGVVPTALFPRAVAASSAAQQVATITGPAVGGLLYALNPTAVYAICFGMFAAAATQLAFLHYEACDDADTGDARRLLRRHRIHAARTASCSASSRSTCSRCCSAAPPRCCRSSPRIYSTPGRPGLGILRAAPAVGALLITVSLARWSFTRSVGRIEFLTVALFGLATIVFASTTWFWVAWGALVVHGRRRHDQRRDPA